MDIHIPLIILFLQCGKGYSKTCSVGSTSKRVKNAALNKPATQISTYEIGTASKAVDDNKNSVFFDGFCTHTYWKESLPLYQWWMVDLEREYRIDSVNITNRLDNADSLRDFDIFVSLNSSFEEDDHMTDESLCIHVSGGMGRGETRTFPCLTFVYGKFVQIYMETLDGRDLNICEVTVEGYTEVCIDTITTTTSPTSNTTTSAVKKAPTKTSTMTPSTPQTTLPTMTSETGTTLLNATLPKTTSNTTERATIVTKTALMTTPPVLLLTGNSTTTATPACQCVCGVSIKASNFTKKALVQFVDKLVMELTVDKKETSTFKRKLISVGDERQSAKTIGFIGVWLCVYRY